MVKQNYFIGQIADEAERERTAGLLREMNRFASTARCRRVGLLGYFGEEFGEENCGACDVCAGEFEEVDATRDARIVLSAIARTQSKFGVVHVCDIVAGANTAKIRQFGHYELKTYGMGKGRPKAYWREVLDALVVGKYLDMSESEYPVPVMNDSGRQLMKGEVSFMMRRDKRSEPERRKSRGAAEPDFAFNAGLFEHLRVLRKALADDKELPPYVIFADRTLRMMAATQPASVEELGRIHGIGSAKVEAYGQTFLKAIAEFLAEHPDVVAEKLTMESLQQGKKPAAQKAVAGSGGPKPLAGTYLETLGMLQKGMAPEAIAEQRGLGMSTIESHLAKLMETGHGLDIRDYVSEEEQALAEKLIGLHGTDALKPIFEAAEEKLSYGKIKLVLAQMEMRKEKV